MTFMKMKFSYKLLILTFFISMLATIYSFDCDQNLGCLLKKKFYGYISASDTRGKAHKLESNIDYKNIYVFRDKIVFYKASLPQENVSEPDVQDLNSMMNESYIERLITFRHVLLECGRFRTRICEASQQPLINQSKEFQIIKSRIANANDKCVTFSFIDSAFRETEEKIAILCITDPRQVKDLISFKNVFSSVVSEYHLKEANTRYDASEGIEIAKGKYISYINNRPMPVIVSMRSKGILLVTDDKLVKDDKKKDFFKTIDYISLRKSGAYTLRRATEIKKLRDGWSDSLSTTPPLDCCIVMPSKYISF